MLLNGGNDINSNNPRYYENIKAMYEAFRSNKVPQEKITVLYGSGSVADTYDPTRAGSMYGAYGSGPGRDMPDAMGGTTSGGRSSFTEQSPQAMGQQVQPQPPAVPPKSFTLEYLFSGDKKALDGAAKKSVLKQKILELQKNLKTGEDLTLFITDHGGRLSDEDQSTINLWGEQISTSELGELLREIPMTSKIRIVTNICFGGGLNDLTSKNICVMANQQKGIPSLSESSDLDLYGQNFAFAIKNNLDFDKDGKATYLDAHAYAASLDSFGNSPMTSLDWYLQKNKNKILDIKREKIKTKEIACEMPSDKGFEEFTSLLSEFEKLRNKIHVTDAGIPSSRKKFLEGRLEKQINKLKNSNIVENVDNLDIRIQALKKVLSDSAAKWSTYSDAQKDEYRQKAVLEAQQLKSKIMQISMEKKKFEALNLEFDFLRYATDEMVEEYKNIKGCLEYAY